MTWLRVGLFLLLAGLLFRGRPWEPLLQWVTGSAEAGAAVRWNAPALLALMALPLIWLGIRGWRAWRGRSRWSGAASLPAEPTPARAAPAPDRTTWPELLLVLLAALAATGFALTAQFLVFQGIPHVQDEINYLWQARLFASGQLSLPSHPLADFFTFRFMVNDGRWYTLFQPGWPLLFALGEVIGDGRLVNPLLGGLLLIACWGVAREVLGRGGGWLAALLLLASPFFLFMQSSSMAHGAAAAVGGCTLWAYLAGQRTRRIGLLGLAGGLLGGLFCIRALDGVVLALPLGLHALWLWLGQRTGRPITPDVARVARPWAGLAALIGAGLLVGSLQFLYNRAVTGDPLVFPQDRYFTLTEQHGDCHRLGFGRTVGCRREHGPDLAPGGFTPWRAVQVSATRLRSLATDLWGPGPGLLLVALGVVVPWRRASHRARPGRGLIPAVAAAPILGYFLYYYHGNCYGARYYYLALPALSVLAVAAVRWLALPAEAAGSGRSRGADWRLAAVTAALLGILAHALAVETPRLWRTYQGGYWGVHAGLARLIEQQQLAEAVVLIPPSAHGPELDDRDYRIGFAHAQPEPDRSPVVIARDLGLANPQLAAYYPTRRFFRYLPWAAPAGRGRLEPWHPDRTEARHLLRIPATAKFPPPQRWGGWVALERFQPVAAPRSHLLRLHAREAGAGFGFRQHVFEAGAYRIRARLARGPRFGNWRLAVDGQAVGPDFDGYANQDRLADWESQQTRWLEPGVHEFRFWVTGQSPAAEGFDLGLLSLELRR